MIVSATTLPVVFIMIAAAPSMIHFIYTDRWLPVLPALYLGLLQMGIIAFTGIFSQLLLARGHPTVMRNIGVVWAILTWIFSPPLIHFFNFVGMSLAGFLVSASGIWLVFRLRKEIDFSFLTNLQPYFVNAAIVGFIVNLLIKTLPNTFGNLVISLVTGVFIYVISAFLFRRREIVEVAKSFTTLLKTS
jgi:O-antigen/teichoic acid export membrane protein